MEDTRAQVDRRGTARDWPVAFIALGVGILLVAGDKFGVLLFWFGVVALLLRRGTFSPRRRD